MSTSLHLETIAPGKEVVTADGVHVGTVKEVDPSTMLVHRALQRDIYIPLGYAEYMVEGDFEGETWIILALTEDQMSVMEWEHPPLI